MAASARTFDDYFVGSKEATMNSTISEYIMNARKDDARRAV
jgi:hypothetical protein